VKSALSLCTVMACLLNAALVRAADRKQLSAALAAVEANLKTPAGKLYDQQLGTIVQQHAASIKQCRQSAANSPSNPFDVFLKLKGDGRVDEALVYPETALATCTRNALSEGKYSPPPYDDYWVNIHLQLKH
jgi:hypothetical protein